MSNNFVNTVEKCPECGLLTHGNEGNCTRCGEKVTGESSLPSAFEHLENENENKNVSENERLGGGFELIAETDGTVLRFEGESTTVNRDNIDPENLTLSGKEHAQFFVKDGQWHIKDLSSNHATFVQVTGEVPLQDGMILVLGQKIFRFNTKS